MSRESDGSAAASRDEPRWPLLAIVLLHLAIVVPLALRLSFWVDETYTLHTTSGTLRDAFLRAIGFERQAPGYFVLLRAFRALDSDFRFTRFFSVIATTALLFVAAAISRRGWPRSPSWVAPALLAVNPAVIAVAVETRVYALAQLLAGCIVLGFMQACESGRRSGMGRYALLVVSGAGALYTQYYLGFVLAALGGVLVASGRFADAKRYAVAMVVVAAAAIPAFGWAFAQASPPEGAAAGVFTNRGAIGYLLYVMSESLIPGYGFVDAIGSPAVGKALGWTLRIAALLVGSIAWRRSRDQAGGRTGMLVAVIALVALQFMLVGRGFNEFLVDLKRYWSFVPVLGAFVVAATLENAVPGRRRFLVLGIVLAAQLALVFVTYRPLAKQGDCDRVARHLMESEREGQPIVVFPNELALPLRLYYHGRNVVAPVPREPVLDRFDPRDPRIDSSAQLEEFFARLPGEEIWLVANPKTDSWGIRYNTELLYALLRDRFSIEEARTFYPAVDVQRLRRR